MKSTRLIASVVLAGVVLVGAAHAWAAMHSHSMNADGISYLDIGEAFVGGEPGAVVNATWSPMYAVILGVALAIGRPSMAAEFPLVHAVNFILFLLALTSFRYFWWRVVRLSIGGEDDARGAPIVPNWALWMLGYLLFAYVSLNLINVWSVTPDMLLSAVVYLVAGVILDIRMKGPSTGRHAALGMLLGVGYLTKAIMLPLAPLFFGAAVAASDSIRKDIPGILKGVAMWILIAGPFVAALSISKHRFEYGSAGKLTYMRYVNDIPYPHWTGATPEHGKPAHPVVRLMEEPPVYTFAARVGGTYPLSYDPSHFYEGARARIDLRRQWARVLASLSTYLRLLFVELGFMSFALVMLRVSSAPKRAVARKWIRDNAVTLVAVAAFALYSLVLVERRYVGVFVALLVGDQLWKGLRSRRSGETGRLPRAMTALMIVTLLVNLAVFNVRGFFDLAADSDAAATSARTAPSWPGEPAQVLADLGVGRGDSVAVVGYPFDSYWARLARVRIVAEVPAHASDRFWKAGPDVRSDVFQAFRSAGATVVVAEYVPPEADTEGWYRVGASAYYIRQLSP